MFKSHYTETVVVVLAIVIGFIMSIASTFVDHLDLNFSNVFKIWAMITLVVLMVSIFIPYKKWSAAITGHIVHDETKIVYRLVDNIFPSLILNTFNTVIVSAANVLYNPEIPSNLQKSVWVEGMLHDWPIMFVISYFAAFAAEFIGKHVAEKNCSK